MPKGKGTGMYFSNALYATGLDSPSHSRPRDNPRGTTVKHLEAKKAEEMLQIHSLAQLKIIGQA